MPPADQEAWKRLGLLLAGRRVQIAARYKNKKLFADERGINRRMLWQIETGARDTYRSDTLRAVEVAYMLAPGSLDRFDGELEPLPADAPRIAAVPAPSPPGVKLAALERIRALIANATPEQLEMLDAVISELVAGDEVLEMMWSAPSRHRLGELMPREDRIRMIALWLADDPRRALDDEGRRGTGTA